MSRSRCPGAPALAALVMACALSLPGCRTPRPAPPAPPRPLFFEEIEDDDLFLGKSMDQIRHLLRKAIDAPVSASFRSATLQSAARELSRKSGLGIGLTPDVCTENLGPIDLELHDLRARHVLDWITRLAGAYYVIEGPRTVFITRDATWASQGRLRMQSYPIGTFVRSERPVAARFNHAREAERLLMAFRYALRHTMTGYRDAAIVLDETGSRLTAVLPPRGHLKLRRIIDELKRPRNYEPPPADTAARARATLLATPIRCEFGRQDARRLAGELGRLARVNVGFDYRRIGPGRRVLSLKLGDTTLGQALDALAKATGLGTVVPESDRRFWILAPGQTPTLLRTTGELPWDRAVVRSHYVKPLVDHFGTEMIFKAVRKAATPGEWDGDLPVAFYHAPSGRLVVIHDRDSQKLVAAAIDRIATLGKAKRPPGGAP